MLGIIVLIVALFIELGFMFYRLKIKSVQNDIKHIIPLMSLLFLVFWYYFMLFSLVSDGKCFL